MDTFFSQLSSLSLLSITVRLLLTTVFAGTLGYGRDDRRLLDLAERSYDVMRCKVDPAAWMADCLHAYALPEGIAAEQTLWGAYYIKARSDALASADAMLAQAEALCLREEALEKKCLPLLQKNRETCLYTHLRAHETGRNLVCRLLLEKKKASRYYQ